MKNFKNSRKVLGIVVLDFIMDNYLLLIGMFTVCIAGYLEIAVFKDLCAFMYAFIGSLVVFLIVKDDKLIAGYSKSHTVGLTLISLALLTIFTALFGETIKYHIIGYIVGILTVSILFFIRNRIVRSYYRYITLYVFVLELLSLFVNIVIQFIVSFLITNFNPCS